ncbi:MAG: hypothetical protein ACTS3T_23850, partial [Almyronema sp.]
MHNDTSIKPLFHIGYHKTGTTWLQNCLFKNNQTINFSFPFERNNIVSQLIMPNQFRFTDDVKQYFSFGLSQAIEESKVPVISHERLSGNPYGVWLESQVFADRLYSISPEAKVLIVIREQTSAILSMYFQYVRNGGTYSL